MRYNENEHQRALILRIESNEGILDFYYSSRNQKDQLLTPPNCRMTQSMTNVSVIINSWQNETLTQKKSPIQSPQNFSFCSQIHITVFKITSLTTPIILLYPNFTQPKPEFILHFLKHQKRFFVVVVVCFLNISFCIKKLSTLESHHYYYK